MENYKNSIFKVITASGTGSGFAINGYPFLVTNYHVVEGSKKVAVEDTHKNRYYADVVMVNPEVDLAFLLPENLLVSHSEIRIDPKVELLNTQKVYINGYPFGMPYTITEGIISSVSQPMGNQKYLQTDAAVNLGNSGGPMLNQAGVLVGVTTSKFNNADNIGFGIKHTDLLKELEDFTFNSEKIYRVKCNSCDTYLEKQSKFCPNCGNSIPESVYEEFEKSHFATFIETALEEEGLNPVLCRAGRDFWEFHQGSALLRIFIYNKDYLIITSPLNKLPKTNLNDLFEFLVSKSIYEPCVFGVSDNTIYLSYRVHLSDIFSDDTENIKNYIKKIPQLADDLDNYFADAFGCEMSIDSKH